MKITMKDGFVADQITFQPFSGRKCQVRLSKGKSYAVYSLQEFVDNWEKGVINALPEKPGEEFDMSLGF